MLRTLPADARAPGCRYGGHVAQPHQGGQKLYGEPGDVCAAPGCATRLSSYNRFDCCCRHGGSKRPRRGEAASAGGTAVTDAAPPIRAHITVREVEMAAKVRQKDGETRAAIAAYIAEHGEGTVAAISAAVCVHGPGVQKHLGAMLEAGKVSRRKVGQAMVYRLRRSAAQAADFDQVQYPERKDAPEAPGAAPAPMPEPPADPAAPSPSTLEPPAAGTTTASSITVEWFGTQRSSDAETECLAGFVRAVELLDRESQVRVAAYIGARYL